MPPGNDGTITIIQTSFIRIRASGVEKFRPSNRVQLFLPSRRVSGENRGSVYGLRHIFRAKANSFAPIGPLFCDYNPFSAIFSIHSRIARKFSVIPRVHSVNTKSFSVGPHIHSVNAKSFSVDPHIHSVNAKSFSVVPHIHSVNAKSFSVIPRVHSVNAKSFSVGPRVHSVNAKSFSAIPRVHSVNGKSPRWGRCPQLSTGSWG